MLGNSESFDSPWAFFRAAAERMFWPKLEPEYQEEIEGIAATLASFGLLALFVRYMLSFQHI